VKVVSTAWQLANQAVETAGWVVLSGVTCLKAGVNEKRLGLDHVIRQFICVSHRLRKVPGQYAPDFVDRFYQRISELLILKMRPHSFHDPLPEFIAAFFMNRVVPNNRKFMNTRRDKNEHRIALARLVHTEPMKLPLRRNEGIALQLPALDQNANLTRRFRFSFPNLLNNPVVLEFAKEFSRSHLITSSIRRRLRRNCRRHRRTR
jgi:hypothetical protein